MSDTPQQDEMDLQRFENEGGFVPGKPKIEPSIETTSTREELPAPAVPESEGETAVNIIAGPMSRDIEVGETLVVGRESSRALPNQLSLLQKEQVGLFGVSANHAEITHTDGGFYIKDIGSSYGTFVNGQRIQGEVPLTQNTEVTLGHLPLLIEMNGSRITFRLAQSTLSHTQSPREKTDSP